ncbi:MAG: UDP-N-acetylglucosamine 2-epimerase (non-hydrolyzing), partial [Solirubrobacterales bacterium]|nr:UDP-N-acetylglucosamine 2-epimerase (non-hydrolyzing) [Solirubrobacterales bacterium]
MKVAIVLGTRPEIIRLSCVIERLDRLCDLHLIHTGQNFERSLSDVFFDELGVRAPDRHFGVAGGTFAERVGAILSAAQRAFDEARPDRLLVLGDTDSALSAYVAKRMGIPVLHMEAGNRCFDDRVPEEVNRRVIDGCSDVLLPYTERSRENLLREGFPPNRVLVIGNPIKEVLDRHDARIAAATSRSELGLERDRYLLLTLHRQETVDHPHRLRSMLDEVAAAAEDMALPVVFSVHPRTREWLSRLDLMPDGDRWRLCEPFGYLDFIALVREARCVLTDSGTVQEECCILRVPAVTVRDVTERPETLESGSNALAGVGLGALRRLITVACEAAGDFIVPPEYLVPHVSATVVKLVLGQL